MIYLTLIFVFHQNKPPNQSFGIKYSYNYIEFIIATASAMRGSDYSFTPDTIAKLKRADQLTEYFSNLGERRSALEVFNLLSTKNNTVYLDEQKSYAIVKTSYLEELQNNCESVQAQIKQGMLKIQNEQKNKASLNKLIQLKDKQLKQVTGLYEAINKRVKQLETLLKDMESMLNQSQADLQYLAFQNQRLKNSGMIQHEFANKLNKPQNLRQKQDKQMQTELQQSTAQNCNSKNTDKQGFNQKHSRHSSIQNDDAKVSVHEALAKKHEQQILRLKQNFQKMLQQVTVQVDAKLQQLQASKLSIERWSNENKLLRQQNKELRETLKNINEQQQKLRIWQNNLQSFVSSAQNSILDPKKILAQLFNDQSMQPQPSSQSSSFTQAYLLKQKLLILESIIDRLNYEQSQKSKKLEEIRQILEEGSNVSDIPEQNIVGSLVSLSSKVKEVVRYFLEQI